MEQIRWKDEGFIIRSLGLRRTDWQACVAIGWIAIRGCAERCEIAIGIAAEDAIDSSVAIGITTPELFEANIFLRVNEVLGHTTGSRSVFIVDASAGWDGVIGICFELCSEAKKDPCDFGKEIATRLPFL